MALQIYCNATHALTSALRRVGVIAALLFVAFAAGCIKDFRPSMVEILGEHSHPGGRVAASESRRGGPPHHAQRLEQAEDRSIGGARGSSAISHEASSRAKNHVQRSSHAHDPDQPSGDNVSLSEYFGLAESAATAVISDPHVSLASFVDQEMQAHPDHDTNDAYSNASSRPARSLASTLGSSRVVQPPQATRPTSASDWQPESIDSAFEIPLHRRDADMGTVRSHGALVTLSVRDAPLHAVLSMVAEQQGMSIVAPPNLDTKVSVTLQPTTLDGALDAILAISGCTWTRIDDVIYVTPLDQEIAANFAIQGRRVRVFDLNYVDAKDAEAVVTGLLSPVGRVFARQFDARDQRKTLDQLVVEDLPPYIDRITEYLVQADQPPRQVMVEVRVLQVKLGTELRHGVNFESLAHLGGADVAIGTQSFASGLGPGAVLRVDGSHFGTLIECLLTTTDAKTLASPKLLMLNGQESRIQIGRRLGYSTSTTTQTVTVQDVQFLDVGVVMTVTPHITADGQILLRINPKVSTGEINPATELPEEETTELDTSVMVADGQGIIIGGLIQESDIHRQSKIPYLGDVYIAGRLFQRRTVARERTEVIVALLPRIVDNHFCPTPSECIELHRIATPIVTPHLQSASRLEPSMPDAIKRPALPADQRAHRRR